MSLIRLFTDFHGRIGLLTFWLGSIAVALLLFAIQRTAQLLAPPQNALEIVTVAKSLSLLPWAALAAKRATDRGSTSLFGILLVCAIVLPEQLRPILSIGWRPSLEAISTMAWVVAFIDLGLMPSPAEEDGVATAAASAKAAE